MQQCARTGTAATVGGGGTRRGIRAAVAAGLAVTALATVSGCAFARPKVDPFPTNFPTPSSSTGYNPYSPTPSSSSYTPSYTYSPTPTEETFDPDGRSDVRGSGCDYSNSLHQFTYTVSITNPSRTSTFSYDMAVNWMKAKPADGTAYGLHQRSVVVAPGATETYTAQYSLPANNYQQFWFTCQITRAHKTKM
ncbi:hypothetical protein [Streptomyces sp. GS7]|uniref:hypothetical protein n=1 Tax=Streptomyces sp. GS7 TaxID=2692234 RepID=UPI0013163BDB|nr:hypothetical protein [Streptomyces sp. GS7]QHC20547.1 hypothetical protein GR130_02925 [Streptomyces sp. GS7]